MKTIRYILPLLLSIISITILTNCDSTNVDDDDDKLPFAVTSFVDQYFGGQGLSRSKKLDNGDYEITVKNGPTMQVHVVRDNPIDPYVSLVSFHGNGATMPVNMATNQLPEALSNYIDGLEMLSSIYDMTRDNNVITVVLLNTTITYDTRTGKITEL